MIIKKSEVYQYLLIYCMLIVNQSVIKDVFLSNFIIIIIVVVLVLNCLFKKKYRDNYIVLFIITLLIMCIILRYTVGGVGISIWLTWTTMILIAYTAIKIDISNFLNRLVKLVGILALISLIFWGLSLMSIQFVQQLMLFSYPMRTNFMLVYTDSINYNTIPYMAYGGIVYVVNMAHPARNCGIFTEPGIYQMVLNTTLFVTLYLRKYLTIKNSSLKRIMIILVLAIISTQSTTGYISLFAVVLPALIEKGRGKLKLHMVIAGISIVIIMVIQYYVKGTESLLYVTILKKLFTTNSMFSLSASSGAARIGTIFVCSESMLQHPFGIGYDKLVELMNKNVTGYVAASIFQTGAACGVIVVIYILYKIFKPIVKSTELILGAKISFLIIYVNNLLSQSVEFYPLLLCIPIFLFLLSKYVICSTMTEVKYA